MTTPDQIFAHLNRTTDQIIGRDDLQDRLASGRPLRIKFGVDCTARDLHLGHAVNLWMMRFLPDLGHTSLSSSRHSVCLKRDHDERTLPTFQPPARR